MDKSKETEMSIDNIDDKTESMDKSRMARRRLLQAGAVAAPLVITFRGNAALAQAIPSGAGCVVGSGSQALQDPQVPESVIVDQNGTPITEGLVITDESGLSTDDLNYLVNNGNVSSSCSLSIMNVGG